MIEVAHLTKRYGAHTAVSDLSFTVGSGQIYGFLGPNGAGKSTTMNIMAGCLSATEGCVRIEGHDIFEEPNQAKRLIGYLPEQPPLYLNETPGEYLRFVGEAKGLRGGELKRQIEEVVRQTKLEDVAGRRISALSKGYRQRVGIAQALLGHPGAIILDEPTVGLDPIQIIEIRDLIKELGQSHTVIFSSHILSEVQALCDQIIMIAGGKLVAFDTPEHLEQHLLALIALGVFISSLTDSQGFAAGTGIAVILLNYYSVSLSEYVSSTAFGSAVALCVLIFALGAVVRHLTRQENLAYGICLVLLAAVTAAFWMDSTKFEGLLPSVMTRLSLFDRFTGFVNGVFDLSSVVYYASVIVFFLFLSIQSLEKRRYN